MSNWRSKYYGGNISKNQQVYCLACVLVMFFLALVVGEFLTSTYNHYKATQYFFESINSNEFLSTPCDSYKNFVEGKCNRSQVFVGYNLNTTLASGNYYLDIKDDKAPDFG